VSAQNAHVEKKREFEEEEKKRGGLFCAELAFVLEDGGHLGAGSGGDFIEAGLDLGFGGGAACVTMFEGVIDTAFPELDAEGFVIDAEDALELLERALVEGEFGATREAFFTEIRTETEAAGSSTSADKESNREQQEKNTHPSFHSRNSFL
jgi:hypothetical protein